MKKNKRPKLLTAIAIFTLITGVLGINGSIPIRNIQLGIKRGGVVTGQIVKIDEIQPNTPAAQADLRPGDRILSINNIPVETLSGIIEIINEKKGEQIFLTIERDGQIIQVETISREDPPLDQGRLGVVLYSDQDINPAPLSRIIASELVRGYSGFEERPRLLFYEAHTYHDQSFSRLRMLLVSIGSLFFGIGILRLRKWAYVGYIMTTIYSSAILLYGLYALTLRLVPLTTYPYESTPAIVYYALYGLGLLYNAAVLYYTYLKRHLFT